MSKPNILLIHVDQLRYDCLGINGHPFVKTPNLDRLASEGTNFRHAYTPAPICSPARASLLTGQWSFQHGCISTPGNEIYRPADRNSPVFSTLLAGAGYRSGWVGKFHNEVEGTPLDWGFTDFIPESAYDAWRTERGLGPKPRENGWYGETDHAAAVGQCRLAWGADAVTRLLETYARLGGAFFLRWDPSEPHLPNVVPEPFASMYESVTVDPWPNFDDDFSKKPYIQAQQKRSWGIDGWTWEKWVPIVRRYLGEISLLDNQIGRILDRIDALGLTNTTMVVFSTDHGDLCGAHGLIDKHFVMYDEITRVPLILRFPGRVEPGVESDAFVSHEIDIASTILDAAGIEAPDTFQGKSLIDPEEEPRRDIFSAYHGSQLGAFSQRMVRNREWKYVWNATCEDELYDLRRDPGELRNVASRTDGAGTLREMRESLIGWMGSLSDPLLNTWVRGAIESGRKH